MRNPLSLSKLFCALSLAGCAGCAASDNHSTLPSSVRVVVSPSTANMRAGDNLQFTDTVSGTSNTTVTWSVNGLVSGSPTLGTISASGNYRAPTTLPNPNIVTVRATSTADPSASGSSSVTLLNPVQSSDCSAMSLGQGASLGGFIPFPADSLWNTDISSAAVDPNSTAIINFIGATTGMHADFGAGQYLGSTIGIPYLIVGDQQSPITINFTAYGSESDPGPMPIPVTAPIEGYPDPGTGDRHVLVLDNSNCFLYELFSAYVSGTSWDVGSAAVWDLLSNEQRPYTWTSADAAGLPIFPGLVRYDEVAAGEIRHALRFTLQHSRAAFVPPATHWAANSTNALAAPMGLRLRLKASFVVSGFSATNQVILNALKKYGMIMADNGSNLFLGGAPDDRWDNTDLHALGQVKASDFEVLAPSQVYTASNLPQGNAPQINSFTASSSSVSAGTPVTLSWQASGASYLILSPEVGAVRGTSVVVTPAQSTTYTLYATNAFGRTTSTVAISVH